MPGSVRLHRQEAGLHTEVAPDHLRQVAGQTSLGRTGSRNTTGWLGLVRVRVEECYTLKFGHFLLCLYWYNLTVLMSKVY